MTYRLWMLFLAISSAGVPATVVADDYYYDDGDFYYDDGGYYEDDYQPNLRDVYRGRARSSAPRLDSRPGYENDYQNYDGFSEWDDGGYDYQQPNYNYNQGGYNRWQYNQGGYSYNQGGYNQYGQYGSPPPPQVAYSNLPITIAMPAGEAGLCAYVLSSGTGSWNYTIAPGQDQVFKEDRAWKVTFDRGNGYGQQSYNLKPGVYRFRQSSRGWELYRGQ